ncbi:MAG: hypothetical protein KDK48_01080 [Chlamydiia bacterium]|nr:hypothetical protein [Chlamydiia bacterium]
MNVDALKIYIDRLAGGHVHKFEEDVDPSLLEMDDAVLRFTKPIRLKGEGYIASDELILHFTVEAVAEMPCSVCNEWTPWELRLKDVYVALPLSEVKGAVFDIGEIVREEILVNIPYVIECEGSCPKRSELGKLLKEEKPEGDVYHPFADL